MNKKFKIIIFIFLLALIIMGGFYFLKENKVLEKGFYFLKSNKNFKTETTAEETLIAPTQKPTPMPTPKIRKEKEEKIPKTYKIKNVPFTSQAPFANWDHDHNEACEEAAILIAHYFYQGKGLNPKIADKEIIGMINYQKENWGSHFDLEAKEIAKLAKEYYGYKNVKVLYDVSIEDIKKEIVKDSPVILPTAGRLLGNPYYKRPGPLYHALVAIGYTRDKIITHDPGTKRGEEYSYNYDTIKKSMHEWNNGDVYNGKKTIIILKAP